MVRWARYFRVEFLLRINIYAQMVYLITYALTEHQHTNVYKIMPDLTLSAAMDTFLAEEDPATVFLPLAGGVMNDNATIGWDNASAIREAGAQGLEIECSVGYRWQWVAGRMILRQINSGQIARIIAIDGITPDATNDITEGFVSGTRWETDDGTMYLCTDSTEDAAVWVDVTAIRVEGGGIVVKGTSNPTASGANTGVDSFISGSNNYSNSGSHCQISGSNNYSNSGSHCQISGSYNFSNSGIYCSISGNYNNTNTGLYCSISGYSNSSNSGDYCQISGNYNFSNSGNSCQISGTVNHTNSGNFCQISGYYNFSNSGTHCSISGSLASFNTLSYARIHGGGDFARIIDVVAKAATTNDTPTTLTLGGAVEGSTNRINIPANSTWSFTATIVARQTSTANAKTWTRRGLIGNNGGAVTISALDTIGTDHVLGTLAASIAITADNTNDALKIVGTGVAATNIVWTAQVNITQVG